MDGIMEAERDAPVLEDLHPSHSQAFPMQQPDCSQLLKEQQEDQSLSEPWKIATDKGTPYFVKNSLLYHTGEDSMEQPTPQLVLPQSRRSQVLKLAPLSPDRRPPGQEKDFICHSENIFLAFSRKRRQGLLQKLP